MKLGRISLGDGAGITASGEVLKGGGAALVLAGSIEGGGQPAGLGQRAQIAGLRPGLVLPLVAGDARFGRPELDGVYRLAEVTYDIEPGFPWAMKLERLAGARVHGETAVTGKMHRFLSPVSLVTTWGRFGVPGGHLGAQGPQVHSAVQRNFFTADGERVVWKAINEGFSSWVEWACTPGQFLAGSPRVEIKAGGEWWALHGQPPAGVPVRVHNGVTGFQVDTGGEGAAILDVDLSTGAITALPLEVSDWRATPGEFVSHAPTVGVNVVRADSEVLWIRWTQNRVSPSGVRDEEGVTTDLLLRRGMAGFTVFHSLPVTVSLGDLPQTGLVYDGGASGTVIGITVDAGAIIAQQEAVTRSTPPARTRDFDFWRWEAGSDRYELRAWVEPILAVYP